MFRIIWIIGMSHSASPYAVSVIGLPLWLFCIGGVVLFLSFLVWVLLCFQGVKSCVRYWG